jgi:hypothetical protein
VTVTWFARAGRSPWGFVVVAMLYAIAAVVAELHAGSRFRSVLLAGQYLVLLPYAVAIINAAPATGARVADIERWIVSIAVLAIAVYWDRGMLWGDETAYRVQAQIFATGKPWIDAPTGLSADELRFTHFIVHDGHWFTKYPPLWPLVLAAGDLVHARWLVNPILGAVALWIIHRIARHELGLANPRFAVAIVLVSPFFFMMAASQMSHMLGLVCVSAAVLAFLSGVRTQRVRDFALAIALLAVCSFVRPFTAFCAAIALAPWLLARNVRALLPRIAVTGIAIGGVAVVALGLYNQLYTGDYLRSPYALYRGTELPIELSASPRVMLTNLAAAARWALQDTMIFTWPLMFALAGYALWVDRGFHHRFLAWCFLVFAAANLFHTEGSASRFGDRYLFEVLWAPALLAARGAALAITRCSIRRRTAAIVIAALTAVGVVQAIVMIRPILGEIAPYVHVHDAVAALPDDGSLVFFPVQGAFTGDRFNLNAPGWRDAPHMFLVDPGPDRRAAIAAAVGRARWIVLGYTDQPTILASGAARP